MAAGMHIHVIPNRGSPPVLLRAHKPEALLAATERHPVKTKTRVEAGTLAGQDAIGGCAGKVINPYKVARRFRSWFSRRRRRAGTWRKETPRC